MMSALPATARPLLSPRSSCSWLIVRQSGASNGVAMLNSPHRAALQRLSTLPENVLHDYSHQYRETATEKQVASDQALVRATACAIVDKLNSGEVPPLDLRQVEHAGIRRRCQYFQRGFRRDAKPLGYFALCRRLFWRCGGRARDRYGLACAWLGHGGIAA